MKNGNAVGRECINLVAVEELIEFMTINLEVVQDLNGLVSKVIMGGKTLFLIKVQWRGLLSPLPPQSRGTFWN